MSASVRTSTLCADRISFVILEKRRKNDHSLSSTSPSVNPNPIWYLALIVSCYKISAILQVMHVLILTWQLDLWPYAWNTGTAMLKKSSNSAFLWFCSIITKCTIQYTFDHLIVPSSVVEVHKLHHITGRPSNHLDSVALYTPKHTQCRKSYQNITCMHTYMYNNYAPLSMT